MFTDPFNTLSTFEKAATVALYLTLAVIVFGVIVGILVKKFRPDSFKNYTSALGAMSVGYSIGLIGILLFLKLDEYIADGYIDNATFIPVVCLLCSVIVLAVCGLIIAFFKPEKFRLFAKIALGIIGAFVLAIIIATMVKNYQSSPVENIGNEVMLYVFTAILAGAIIFIALFFGKKNFSTNDTKSIVYAAVTIAMSFALSYIRFLELPQGGSITLASLVPLMIYSYMFGIRKGLLAGIIYGFLQFIQAPWFYHPIQFLLDYPIAFGAIGLAGIFHERKIFENKKVLQFALSAIMVAFFRYLAHVISGIFVFGSADPENYSAVAWSFLYNSFTFADIAICIVAGCALFASKSFNAFLEKSSQ